MLGRLLLIVVATSPVQEVVDKATYSTSLSVLRVIPAIFILIDIDIFIVSVHLSHYCLLHGNHFLLSHSIHVSLLQHLLLLLLLLLMHHHGILRLLKLIYHLLDLLCLLLLLLLLHLLLT